MYLDSISDQGLGGWYNLMKLLTVEHWLAEYDNISVS